MTETKTAGRGPALRRLLAAATAFAGIAAAQSAHADVTLYQGSGPVPSVNVYLRVDAGLRLDTNVDNAQYNGQTGSTTLLQAGGNDWGTSMFGVYGSSQLSSELTGVYKVESGFNATTGTFNSSTNSIFNRRAYVGLSNPQFGTITIGKDLFIDNDVYNFDPMIQENMSTATLVYGRNWGGASNMVEYRSPDWSGLKIGLMAAFDNGDTAFTTRVSNEYGASGEYDIANLSLYAIYDEVQDENGNYTNLYAASKEAIFGATYNLKPVQFFAGYEELSAPNASEANERHADREPGFHHCARCDWLALSGHLCEQCLYDLGWRGLDSQRQRDPARRLVPYPDQRAWRQRQSVHRRRRILAHQEPAALRHRG